MRTALAIPCVLAILMAAPAFGQRGAAQGGARAAAAKERGKEKETPIERWNRMTPEERRRALAKLPPERRREIQDKIERFRSLPPEERQRLRERYQTFQQLPPEQQAHARELFRQFNSLPEDRRPLVRQEYEQLRSMPENQRQARINNAEFNSKFTPAEQQMLRDLTQTFGSPR
jgi:uncharacterized protein DUF3106